MGQQGVFDALPGNIVFENEVFVWNYGFVLESDDRAVTRRPFDFDFVERRPQPIDTTRFLAV